MHTLLLSHETFATLNANNVRLVLTGGANSDPPLLTKLYEAYPNAVVMNLYGLSEVYGPAVVCAEKPSWADLPPEEQATLKARQGVAHTVLTSR